jgi:dissimilatory sulfite reductase related protein
MQTLQTAHRAADARPAVVFDEDGYLLDHRLWSAELGRAIAEEEGLGDLTERHWRVIDHVRERFFALGAVPNLRRVCRATSLSKGEVYLLFGGCLRIWRIAGLPNPGEEARAYLD